MKDILFYLTFAIILYLVLSRVFENFNIEQENFDPSLVPVSSIVILAKVAQKLINGNGILTNPSSLTIGTSTSTPANLIVTGRTIINGGGLSPSNPSLTVKGLTDIKGNTTIRGNTDITGTTTINKDLIIKKDTTIGGTVDVKGKTTLNKTLGVTGNTTIKGTVNVTGDTTITGNLIISNLNAVNPTNNITIDAAGNLSVKKITEKGLEVMPRGIIVPFYSDAVPGGWLLCDGANGTPDLRGRFIRMVSDPNINYAAPSSTWPNVTSSTDNIALKSATKDSTDKKLYGKTAIFKYVFGEMGGSDVIQLTKDNMPNHTHLVTEPGHNHQSTINSTGGAIGQGSNSLSDADWYNESTTMGLHETAPLRTALASSNITINSTGGQYNDNNKISTDAAHCNTPPYYVLIYIMKE